MAAIQYLLSAFVPAFLGVAFLVGLVWMAKRFAPNGCPPFIGPKAFPELSAFPKAEQKRLLHEASREAFRGWRPLVPICLFAAFTAGGVAIGYALPSLTTFPDSPFVWAGITAVAAGFGGWLARGMERRSVRPALKNCIEKNTTTTTVNHGT